MLDYTERLAKIQEKVADKILIIPRIYTNKPRTTGLGYKGLMHQPDPEGEEDVLEGIIAMRRIHTRAIEETGLTSADEMLYPENHRYISDTVGYVAVEDEFGEVGPVDYLAERFGLTIEHIVEVAEKTAAKK